MNEIKEYTVKRNFEVFNKMFLKKDSLFASGRIRLMNGEADYINKIFDAERKYLGWIRNEKFDETYKYFLEEFKSK